MRNFALDMDKFLIKGGIPLKGEVTISGFKNAALPILVGTILANDKCIIENVPNINDVAITLEILSAMGANITHLGNNTVEIDTRGVTPGTSPSELTNKMRGSTYLIGAELGRFHRAHVGHPGGCNIGKRPIDQHIKAFEAIGATVTTSDSFVDAIAPNGLTGSSIYFDTVSVGATANIILASVLAEGTTIIDNGAKEPHIVDLANFLNTCGANISGAGTDSIKIRGVEKLHGCTYSIIPDMIEAGTFMIAAAATHGTVKVKNIISKHMETLSAKMEEMGVTIIDNDDEITVSAENPLGRANIKTLPYPGFPTDLHPQFSALLCTAMGESKVVETVYDNRFKYVDELRKMGANIRIDGNTAIISGGAPLNAADVASSDLRAGAALIIAALSAKGESKISEIRFIERGYDSIVSKLSALGADIKRISE